MLEMGEHGAWIPPVLKTVARTGEGVAGLRAELAKHREFLSGPAGASRRAGPDRPEDRDDRPASGSSPSCTASPASEASIASWAGRIEARSEDPFRAAEALLETLRRNGGPAAPTDGVRRISHLGLAVASVDGGGAFWDLLGLVEEHREEVASQKVVTSFRPVGESALELLEPTAPESPIAKFLEKKGPGIHHLCLEVADVAATLAKLKAAGVRLVERDAVRRGRTAASWRSSTRPRPGASSSSCRSRGTEGTGPRSLLFAAGTTRDLGAADVSGRRTGSSPSS